MTTILLMELTGGHICDDNKEGSDEDSDCFGDIYDC